MLKTCRFKTWCKGDKSNINEKALRGDANTARWLYKAGDKNFRPAANPFPGGAGRPKFNQLEMVTTFTHKPSFVRIDACNLNSSYHWQQIHNSHTPIQTGPITIHCAAASAQCKTA